MTKASDGVSLPVQPVPQRHSWDCGPAAIAAVAHYLGVPFSGHVPGSSETQGTPPEAMLAALRQLGLKVQAVERMTVAQLDQAIRAGCPVLICLQALGTTAGMKALESGHWAVATGSAPKGITLTDSVVNSGKVVLGRPELLRRWVDKAGERPYVRFGIVVGKFS